MKPDAPNESMQEFRDKYEQKVLPFYRSGRFGELTGVGGVPIRYACFEKEAGAGALVLLPGKSETYLKYAELFYDLQELGLSLYCLDHRGMGFSGRMLEDRCKVHVEDFRHYLSDARSFVEGVVKARRHERIFLMGHSLGGLIGALYLAARPNEFRAGILSAPMIEINTAPWPAFLARILAGLLDRPGKAEEYGPGQENRQPLPFERNRITHSRARYHLWEEEIIPGNEEIQPGGVTNHWLRESLRWGRRALRQAGRLALPLLLLQAEEDLLTRTRGQDRFCRRAPLCRKVVIRGARHEILIERDDLRDQALAQIRAFLEEQLRPARGP